MTVSTFLPHSPFKVSAGPAHDASKVRASGPGLNTSGVAASLPVEFTIDARDAGEGLLTVQILVGFLFPPLSFNPPSDLHKASHVLLVDMGIVLFLLTWRSACVCVTGP